jgi:hypothetical protein
MGSIEALVSRFTAPQAPPATVQAEPAGSATAARPVAATARAQSGDQPPAPARAAPAVISPVAAVDPGPGPHRLRSKPRRSGLSPPAPASELSWRRVRRRLGCFPPVRGRTGSGPTAPRACGRSDIVQLRRITEISTYTAAISTKHNSAPAKHEQLANAIFEPATVAMKRLV